MDFIFQKIKLKNLYHGGLKYSEYGTRYSK